MTKTARDALSGIEAEFSIKDKVTGEVLQKFTVRYDAEVIATALRVNGFAIVPVEPTEAMLSFTDSATTKGMRLVAQGIWDTMLKASQEQSE